MTKPPAKVTVHLRIPGKWSEPRELLQRLPEDCRLTPDSFVLPDKTKLDFTALPPDEQFAGIFRSACRRMPTDAERDAIDSYDVNVILSGPGGSLDAARTMMEAASVIVRAGGAGVFIDNCGLAHGGENWLNYTEDGTADAVSFAFVSIVRGKDEVYTVGMHVLGLRDVVMKRSDIEAEGFDIVEVILYLCRSDKPIEDGHLIADPAGPRFQALVLSPSEAMPTDSPMHNPFGRLKLVSMKDIAETN